MDFALTSTHEMTRRMVREFSERDVRPKALEYDASQTFPDDWEVHESLTAKYRQIGNAVPVQFGEAVGRHVLAFYEGREAPPVTDVAQSRYRNTDETSWRRRLSVGA